MKKKAYELVNDPKYITVHTDDRYLRGPTARVLSKNQLKKIISNKQELEYDCLSLEVNNE